MLICKLVLLMEIKSNYIPKIRKNIQIIWKKFAKIFQIICKKNRKNISNYMQKIRKKCFQNARRSVAWVPL